MKADFTKLDRAFHPACVVVVGDKKESNYTWLNSQKTFKGKLYSVQIAAPEIEGIKALGVENFLSLKDVPGPVDLVISAVPRPIAPHIMEDCIRKDVAAVHYFTSGFSETDTPDGIELERRLRQRAEETNLHIIGPNCMGIFNPGIGLRQQPIQYADSTGPVGFISQSGTHAVTFSIEAHNMGLDIWKSVSFGNGIVLDSPDYLEYFAQDPEIKVIGMYLEGVKDGKRFLNTLKEVASRKPVVIWKGGRTEAGGRAIASHTGSLAVSQAVFSAAIRQCGAIQVSSLDQMVDVLKALLYLAPVYGDRVAVAGGSGGQSVAIADVFAENGLKLPLLTKASYDEFASFFTVIGGSYRNPVDTGNVNRWQLKRIMDILERDGNVENLVLLGNSRLNKEQAEVYLQSAIDIRPKTAKPVMAILTCAFATEDIERTRDMMQKLQANGIPAFTALDRCAFALKTLLDYYRRREGGGE